MSEFQVIAFRAVDRPVSGDDLEFMRTQSSRAEITPWSFDVEYNYGDFRGDEMEMLRRGYDLFVHYSNYGTRRVLIRLPHGLPDRKGAEVYFRGDAFAFVADKKGRGGTLCVEPFLEDMDYLDVEQFVDRLIPLRDEIEAGDLRPLYVAYLATIDDCNHDWEDFDPPLPAGMADLTDAQRALAEFYDISDYFLKAVAEASPEAPRAGDATAEYDDWLRQQDVTTKDAWLADLLANPRSSVRGEMLEEYRQERGVASWPTVEETRSIEDLESRAEQLRVDAERKRRDAELAAERKALEAEERRRAKRRGEIAKDPQRFLRETEQLVAKRGSDSYREAAEILADMRSTFAGTPHESLAGQQAEKLRNTHPTLSRLIAALRREGFLPKK